MKKISKIVIKNFQSHKATAIDFSDFTAIIGATNSGKSAVIRAIKWCLYNQPSGTDFIMNGESEARVTLFFNDGLIITRARGTTKNFYEIINDEMSAPIHLEGFGVGPVKEVVEAHGMREASFGSDSEILNICDQLSSPFFLSGSSAERAVMIGKLANTDVIDAAIKNTSSEIREDKVILKGLKGQITEVNKGLKELKDLAFMEQDLNDVFEMKIRMQRLIEKITKVENADKKLELLNIQKENLEKIISKEDYINRAIEEIYSLSQLLQKMQQLQKINASLVNSSKLKMKLETLINNIDIIHVEQTIKDLDRTLSHLKNLVSIKLVKARGDNNRDKLLFLQKSVTGADGIEKAISDLSSCHEKRTFSRKVFVADKARWDSIDRKVKGEQIIQNLQKQYEQKFSNYKNELLKNPVCPICQSDVTQDKVQNIKDLI